MKVVFDGPSESPYEGVSTYFDFSHEQVAKNILLQKFLDTEVTNFAYKPLQLKFFGEISKVDVYFPTRNINENNRFISG